MRFARFASLAPLLALAMNAIACGGDSPLPGSPTAPTVPTGPTNPTTTSIKFDSHVGASTAGITVRSGEHSAVINVEGVAAFDVQLAAGAPLALSGGSFLDHGCTYGGGTIHGHTLLGGPGYSKTLLQSLMFAAGSNITNGTTLIRLDAPASVILDPGLRGNSAIVAAIEKAAALNTGLHPTLPFHTRDGGGNLLAAALPGTVPVNIRVDSNAPYAGWTTNGGTGGRIERVTILFRDVGWAAHWNTVAHEMGHAFGFGHNLEGGLMSPGAEGIASQDFTPKEKKAAEFMLARSPGTRWEDTIR